MSNAVRKQIPGCPCGIQLHSAVHKPPCFSVCSEAHSSAQRGLCTDWAVERGQTAQLHPKSLYISFPSNFTLQTVTDILARGSVQAEDAELLWRYLTAVCLLHATVRVAAVSTRTSMWFGICDVNTAWEAFILSKLSVYHLWSAPLSNWI